MEGSDDVGSPGANGNAQGGGREGRKSSRWWRRSTAKSSDESVRPKEESGNGKAAKPRPEPVSIRKLYSFADRLDYVLMLFGCFGCIVHGATVPFMVLIYGKMLNDLGSGFSAYEINKVKYCCKQRLLIKIENTSDRKEGDPLQHVPPPKITAADLNFIYHVI